MKKFKVGDLISNVDQSQTGVYKVREIIADTNGVSHFIRRENDEMEKVNPEEWEVALSEIYRLMPGQYVFIIEDFESEPEDDVFTSELFQVLDYDEYGDAILMPAASLMMLEEIRESMIVVKDLTRTNHFGLDAILV